MSTLAAISLALSAASLLAYSRASAHVPFLQAQLGPLLGASHCVAAARLHHSSPPAADGAVLASPVISWCGRALPDPLHVEPGGLPVDGTWVVLFLRREAAGWRALTGNGVVLRIERRDFPLVHRALRHAFFLARRPDATPVEQRKPWWSLLRAQDPTWRYHAALELWSMVPSRASLSPQERRQLQELARHRSGDAAIGLLQRLP